MSEKKAYTKEVKKLIAMGKSKGYLTYEEVNVYSSRGYDHSRRP